VFELGAGNQTVNAGIGPDLDERFKLIGEGQHIVAARLKHAGHDQSGRAAGIDESDAHQHAHFVIFQAARAIPLSLD